MLQSLSLENVRSYRDGLFVFASGVNIIVGPNASGKTNLLESIHMASMGSGFKSDDEHMIARGHDWGRIDARYDDHERSVKLRRSPPSKSFVVDDIEKKRLSSVTTIPVVLFEPSHMQLLVGGPEARRSYVDGILSQTQPEYKRMLAAYKRTLAQRNRLLKQDHSPAEHMFVWDLRLSELAGWVVERRRSFIDSIGGEVADNYRSVSGASDELRIYYDSRLPAESYVQSYLQKLKADYELDRLRGFTGSGPHRDDIGFELSGNEARASASRGETRSIVLSMKIAELNAVRQGLSRPPLLLLDDVFSELDGRRRRMLAGALQDTQTFITTTDADAIVKSFMQSYNVITTG